MGTQAVFTGVMANLAQILDHLTPAVIVLDEALKIVYLNDAAESLCGKSKSRLLTKSFSKVFNGDSFDTEEIIRCLQTERSITQREVTLEVPGSNEHLTTNFSVSPLSETHLLLQIEIIDRVVNIDRETRIRNSLVATQQLIRGLAHEVKNPLLGIRGAAQLLRDELTENSLYEYTDVIISETDRLRTLIDRMLLPGSIQHVQSVNLHEILEKVLRVLGVSMREESKTIPDFQRNYDPSLPEVQGDPDQLQQAFLNLIRNAIDALQDTEDPQIRFTSKVQHQVTIGSIRHRIVAELIIEDNGPGIPEELQEQIYYPMISGRVNGTGLGLPIAQAIITKHNGFIHCVSDPGSTQFIVYLPLESMVTSKSTTSSHEKVHTL